jgi:hypothetical protein
MLAGVSKGSFKKSSPKTYQSILSKLTTQFVERHLNSLTADEILSFLAEINQGIFDATRCAKKEVSK